ncbi:ABC transporter ATP-binding protein [Mycoplasma sp. P36-A1]|uniref:ABC transporter ATP-binding protein n=1 Tax=Mycoplasma sp. P36-A1 TaxID=3252900 RepID=UPI003C2F6B8F
MAIKVKNLKVFFDKKQIINIKDFDSSKGNFIGIIGPNGCGKSTFLKVLYKENKDYHGIVEVDNKDIKQYDNKSYSTKISALCQHNHFDFSLSINQIVSMARYSRKKVFQSLDSKDINIIKKSIELVNLKDYEDKDFNNLSGGQQQRAILARAIAQDSTYLLLDEPTNHLDIYYQLEIMEMLKKQNKPIISIIHDVNIALTYCDYIYVMNEGSFISQGRPEEVINHKIIKDIFKVNSQEEININKNKKQLLLYI